jgi:glyoxylase-like metal-dependent hydrolase (beta-lactamase superfamily II)
MPSSTTNSTHLHSALSRIRNWRPLAKITAVGAATAVTGGVTLSMLSGGAASAATKPAWDAGTSLALASAAARVAAAAVLAGQADAPFLRSGAPLPAPDLADWERPIHDQVTRQLPATPLPPARVDQELRDGDELDFGGGAVTIAVPGHTPGSIACYLPRSRVLIAGDAIARRPDGQAMLGVFNVDPAQAAASFARLAALDTEIVCAGHADPITEDAAAFLRATAGQLG